MDFLNKKPWHPGSYKNRTKVYLAEEQQRETQKKHDALLDEYRAERSTTQQQQGMTPVMFLYAAPPGYPSGCSDGKTEKTTSGRSVGDAGRGSREERHRVSHVSHVLEGIRMTGVSGANDQSHTRKECRDEDAGNTVGQGLQDQACNERAFVVNQFRDDDEEQLAYELALLPDDTLRSKELKKQETKRRKRIASRERRRKLKRAQKVLAEAGLL